VADSLKKKSEKQAKQIHDFQQSIANIPPPPPLSRNQTINELKTALMAQLMVDGTPEDTDLVRALQRQAAIQKSVYDIQKEALDEDLRRSQVVTRMDFLDLQTSMEQKMSEIADIMKKALDA